MGDTWFTGYSDELARCLVDAQNCAEVCEAYLDTADGRASVEALAAPAAVSRVLIELIDRPPALVLAAVRLCRDLTSAAADELGADAPPPVVDALRRVATSAGQLLEATG